MEDINMIGAVIFNFPKTMGIELPTDTKSLTIKLMSCSRR